MSNIIPFKFGKAPVRVIEDGIGGFDVVAKDVAEGLGYTWQANVIAHVPEEWKGVKPINTPGGVQQMSTLTESGLYFFLGRSDKPDALPMQKWVSGEVLPSIRKTGSYSVAPVDVTDVFSDPNILRTALLGYTEKVIALEGKVADLEPKAAALDRISASNESLTMTQAAKVLEVKLDDLTTLMRQKGWIYRQNESWVAYDKHLRNGDLKYKEAKYTDENLGQKVVRPYCHILPKGLTKLARMLETETVAS